jgi:hypothetical protein
MDRNGDLANFLPRLTLNYDLPDLCLLRHWDCRCATMPNLFVNHEGTNEMLQLVQKQMQAGRQWFKARPGK